VTSIDPYRWVDGTSIRAILNPIEVIWTILFVHVANGVKKLVVDTSRGDAPVGKTKCLPAGLDVGLAVCAARADSDVGPATISSRIFACNVNTDVVAEFWIVDKLNAAHGQSEVVKLVVDLLPVLGRNCVLDSVRDDVFTLSSLAARIFFIKLKILI